MRNNVIRSIAIMLIGLLLIFMSDSGLELLIRVVGAAFFLPAMVSVINIYISRAQSGIVPKVVISVIDVGSMAFGVWLMAAPSHFQGVFVKLLAIVLLIFAIYQVVMIVSAQRYSMVPMQMYIAPLVLIVVAIIMLTVSFRISTMSIIFGACAFISGLSDMLIAFKFKATSPRGLMRAQRGDVQKL